MRNMVEHGHTRGSSDTTVLSGCSSSRRLTRWISVPTPMTDPAGASSTARMMKSVDPTSSASSTTSWAHSGWMSTMPVGVLGPEGVDVLGPEALVDRAVALPQQQGGLLDVGVVEAAHARGGGSTPACRPRPSRAGSRCCGPGAGRGRTGPCRPGPRRSPAGSRAQESTARALDDVHTAPAVAAHEGLQGGRGVHVGDGDDRARRR